MTALALVVSESGRTFTFTGSDFEPGDLVSAMIYSNPIALGQQTADSSGVVVFTWTAPTDFSGHHQIVMTGVSGQVSAWFDVPVGPSATTATTAQGVTAPTGGTTAAGWRGLLLVSAGLFGAGLLAGWRSRRRTR